MFDKGLRMCWERDKCTRRLRDGKRHASWSGRRCTNGRGRNARLNEQRRGCCRREDMRCFEGWREYTQGAMRVQHRSCPIRDVLSERQYIESPHITASKIFSMIRSLTRSNSPFATRDENSMAMYRLFQSTSSPAPLAPTCVARIARSMRG